MTGPLTGFTIGVTAHRRADEQIELLERKGATVVHAPTIHTHPLAPEAEVAAVTRSLVERPPEFTLLSTGIGIRAWIEAAETIGMADELVAALGSSTVLARGPKARGAALTNGLDVAWHTSTGRSSEMVAELARVAPSGARVAVQLDGTPGAPLAKAVAAIGCAPVPVPVYEWTLPVQLDPIEKLIDGLIERRVHGVTFTARPQVENLVAVAERIGRLEGLRVACASAVVVSVGPVCTESLVEHRLGPAIEPSRYRLGSMVHLTAETFHARALELTLAGCAVRVQGRAVVIDRSEPVWLSETEHLVLDALATRPGVVWSKAQLLDHVWSSSESDAHVVEVTVGRLRSRLGAAGAGIETVIRRGYRLTSRPPDL